MSGNEPGTNKGLLVKTKIETWLPVFSGFYGTIWGPDSEIESAIYSGDLPKDCEWWKHFNNAGYMATCCRGFCKYAPNYIPKQFAVASFEFQEVRSPREYNFTNDACNIAVELDCEQFGKAFAEYISTDENLAAFESYLVSHYKSCDGFISFHPHTVDEWREQTDGWKKFDPEVRHFGKHALGSLLQFIMLNEDEDCDESIYDRVKGNMESAAAFVDLPKAEGAK